MKIYVLAAAGMLFFNQGPGDDTSYLNINHDGQKQKIDFADPASEFVQELKKFVSSIKNERFRNAKYWDEMDKLWEALQLRKDDLQEAFSESQLNQIRKLEKRYQRLRNKGTRTS